MNINQALNKFFNFSAFRTGQEEVINSLLNGNDTLVVMPTGGGKSICYQIPAIVSDGCAIVISPLIALMKDQVDALNNRGIPSVYINSTLDQATLYETLHNAIEGQYKLIYVAPERLDNRNFLNMLREIKISFIAIDEAHCISEWGHEFRPAYLNIKNIFQHIDRLPVIALTATATPDVQNDIANILQMKTANRFVKGFDRPNLSYKTEFCLDKSKRLYELCKEQKTGSTIIYCGSRKRVDTYSEQLRDKGLKVDSYHAGLADNFRSIVQDNFISDKTKIIIATNAFGMGIDKSDVRRVIHLDLTATLEAYYQEAGRAGRDGANSDCILLYHPSDRDLQDYFIYSNYPNLKDIEKTYNALYNVFETPMGAKEYNTIITEPIKIANSVGISIHLFNSCFAFLEKNKIVRKNSTSSKASLKILSSRDRVKEYFQNTTEKRQNVLGSLLRGITSDVFSSYVDLDLIKFSYKYSIDLVDLKEVLEDLDFSGILDYKPDGMVGGITLLVERSNFSNLEIDFELYEKKKARAIRKLDSIQDYASTLDCKRNYILDYFQESKTEENCNHCSSCLGTKTADLNMNAREEFYTQSILSAVFELDGNFGRNLVSEYLYGDKSKKILHYSMQDMSNFGILKERPLKEILNRIDKLMFQGLINSSGTDKPTILLSKKGLDKLKFKPYKANIIKSFQIDNINRNLLLQLKTLRNDLASKNKIVPRAIASDIILRRVVMGMPTDKDSFISLTRANENIVKYSELFVNLVRQELSLQPLSITNNKQKSESNLESMIYAKKSLSSISKSLKINPSDLAIKIEEMIFKEPKSNVFFYLIDEESVFIAVCEIMKKTKNASLALLKSKLQFENLDMPELRIMRALARKSSNQ
ncbi:MAG: ATP-dependent DNA helicase [Candidatus Kapabacteria bacterium]|nr:ATP-dependent DNA helicase [Candidatus Kapabacteria bacterium]